jgi:hypothetical protein
MERRVFIAAAAGAGGAWLSSPAAEAAGLAAGMQGTSAEYYELRRYRLRRGPQQQLVDAYMRDALVPALQRAGTGPVGVFNVTIGADNPTLHLLITYRTLDAFTALPARLAADGAYQTAGAAYLNAIATSPAFVRIESSLMRAFDSMPALALPFGGGEAGRRSRIFELRVYESHSENASRKKIGMFDNGEIAIFRKAGLQPVFFGNTLIGQNMPNLAYMLVYEDMAARDRQWAAFAADPEWRKLSTTPGLTDPDIVTSISNTYLRPTAYSHI